MRKKSHHMMMSNWTKITEHHVYAAIQLHSTHMIAICETQMIWNTTFHEHNAFDRIIQAKAFVGKFKCENHQLQALKYFQHSLLIQCKFIEMSSNKTMMFIMSMFVILTWYHH